MQTTDVIEGGTKQVQLGVVYSLLLSRIVSELTIWTAIEDSDMTTTPGRRPFCHPPIPYV